MTFGLRTSGEEREFGPGLAVRDKADGKPRPDLRSPFAAIRVGEHLCKGARRYAPRNWEKGMPFSECVASLSRHLLQFQQGDRAEDHLAAIVFNAEAIMHYQAMIARGRLPGELDDLPDYSGEEERAP